MKRMAMAGALLLAACGAPIDGLVEGKQYKPPYDTQESRPLYTTICHPVTHTSYSNGRVSTYTTSECRQQFMGYDHYTQHHDECYEITVKQDEDGKMRTKCVIKVIYDGLDVGEHYSEKEDES